MRPLFAGMLAVLLLASPMASAEQCQQPKEKSAFDIAGLKSQLMVTALTCDAHDKFNSFVVRFRAVLQGQEKTLISYFARAFGRRGQTEHDDYITQLANAQSSNGLRRGTLFCTENVGLFDEVLSLPPSADLGEFAASKRIVQPVDFQACPAAAPSSRTASAVAARKQP